MVREATGQTAFSDAALITALVELGEAGGEKRYVHCRFGFSIASKLVSLGLATIDDAPTHTAVLRLTNRGRSLLKNG